MNHDAKCEREVQKYPQAAIGWLIMASWIYYFKPALTPLLSDTYFDKLSKQTLQDYDGLTHRYKHLVSKDDLKAGSLYSLGSYDYPIPLIVIAEKLSESLT